MNAKCEQHTFLHVHTYSAIRYIQQFLFIIFSSVSLRCSPMKYIFIIPEKKKFVLLFFFKFISRQFEPRKREDFSECDDCFFFLKNSSFSSSSTFDYVCYSTHSIFLFFSIPVNAVCLICIYTNIFGTWKEMFS